MVAVLPETDSLKANIQKFVANGSKCHAGALPEVLKLRKYQKSTLMPVVICHWDQSF